MEDSIKFSVVTAGGTVFEDTVSYVNIPTDFGSLGILKGHAAMFCAVGKGAALCRYADERTVKVAVDGGVANVAENEVTILTTDGKLLEA